MLNAALIGLSDSIITSVTKYICCVFHVMIAVSLLLE